MLLYVGGYDALNSAIVVCGFPAAIVTIFVVIAAVKFLSNRKKYDYTYREELGIPDDVPGEDPGDPVPEVLEIIE